MPTFKVYIFPFAKQHKNLDFFLLQRYWKTFVKSRLDNCNAILFRCQNLLVPCSWPSSSSHWTKEAGAHPSWHFFAGFQFDSWLNSRSFFITYKALCFQVPSYIVDLLKSYHPLRLLHLTNVGLFVFHKIKKKNLVEKFQFSGSSTWNHFPASVQTQLIYLRVDWWLFFFTRHILNPTQPSVKLQLV